MDYTKHLEELRDKTRERLEQWRSGKLKAFRIAANRENIDDTQEQIKWLEQQLAGLEFQIKIRRNRPD
jgi:hypothetical protein